MTERDWIFIAAVDDGGREPRLSTRWLNADERDRLLLPQPFLRPHILIDGTSGRWRLRRDDENAFRAIQPAVGLLACHLLATPGWHTIDELVSWYALRIAKRPLTESTKATVRTQIRELRRAMSFDRQASEEYVEVRRADGAIKSAYRLRHQTSRPFVALLPSEHDETVGVTDLDWDVDQRPGPLPSSVADDLKVALGVTTRHRGEGGDWSLELELCSSGINGFAALSLTLGRYVEEPGASPQQCYTPHVRFTGPSADVESGRPVVLSPMRRVSFQGYSPEQVLAGLLDDEDAKVRLALELERGTVFLLPPSKLIELLREISNGVGGRSPS